MSAFSRPDEPGASQDEPSGSRDLRSGSRDLPSAEHDEPRVVHEPGSHRFAIFVGDTRAGLAAYRDEPGRRVFTHTEVDPAYEGRGLGSRLAAFALEDAAARGLSVVAVCPFIAAYAARHPEYGRLVVPA